MTEKITRFRCMSILCVRFYRSGCAVSNVSCFSHCLSCSIQKQPYFVPDGSTFNFEGEFSEKLRWEIGWDWSKIYSGNSKNSRKMDQINLPLMRTTEWERTPSVTAKSVWYESRKKLRYLMKSCLNFLHRQVKIVGEKRTLHSMYCNIVDVVWLIFKLIVEENFALCTLYRTCLPYFR